MLSHIVLSVSRDPVYSWMASRVFCKFSFVDCLIGAFLDSFIPLYVMAWVSVFSFGPYTSNSSGIVRSIGSSSSLFAPSFANSLLPSFPSFPLCPLIHWKVVGAVRSLRRWATFLKRGAFLMPIQPQFSHCPR